MNNLFELASEAWLQGNVIQSEKLCIELHQQNSTHSGCLHLLGLIHFKKENYSEAISFINLAIKYAPDDGSCFNSLGNIYRTLGQWEKALFNYSKALQLKPDEGVVFHNMGLVYLSCSKFDEAIIVFLEAIKLKANTDSFYRLRELLRDIQPQKSIDTYRQIIDFNPEFLPAYTALGFYYLNSDQIPEAIHYYQEALSIEPDNFEVNFSLAELYSTRNEYKKALSLLKAINLSQVVTQQHRFEVYRLMGELFDSLENYSDAQKYLLEAFCLVHKVEIDSLPEPLTRDSIDSRFVSYLISKALILQLRSFYEQSSEVLNLIIAIQPTHTLATYCLKRLPTVQQQVEQTQERLDSSLSFDIVIPVWGAEYTRLFLEYCLPSLMAEENLPKWKYLSNTRFKIFSTAEDIETIKSNHVFLLAEQLVTFVFTEIDLSKHTGHSKYVLMTELHKKCIMSANIDGSSLIFIPPDNFYSNQLFSEIESKIASNAKVILLPAYCVSTEALDQDIQPQLKDLQLDLSSEKCSEIFINHMSRDVETAFFDENGPMNSWPAHMYYWKNHQTLALRAFHLHPLIFVEPLPANNFDTIDGGYLSQYIDLKGSVAVLDNGVMALSLQTLKEASKYVLVDQVYDLSKKLLLIDEFKRRQANQLHQRFFSEPFLIQTNSSVSKVPEYPIADILAHFWTIETLFCGGDYERLIELMFQWISEFKPFKNTIPIGMVFFYTNQALHELKNSEIWTDFKNRNDAQIRQLSIECLWEQYEE